MKRALKIILISLVSICVLAVAAVYVLLTQIDFNAYKESIVKIVYNATGRQLTIGDIQVKPSFNPVIEVQDADNGIGAIGRTRLCRNSTAA